MNMRNAVSTLASLALATGLAACVSEGVDDGSGGVGEAQQALQQDQQLLNREVVANPVLAYQSNLSWNRRYWANSFDWSAAGCSRDGGCVAIYNGLWGHPYSDWFSAWGTNAYCTSYSWGNQCNSSYNNILMNSGWGWYFRNGFGSWDTEGQQPAAYGWSTFGQHPYWCVGAGASNTWQGWSSTNHC
jgi:hypothetical protein